MININHAYSDNITLYNHKNIIMVTNKELVFDDTEGVWSATFLWTYNAITRTIIASMVLKQGDIETLKHIK